MEYYNKNGVVVRDSIEEDVQYLKDRLRQSDIDEIWDSHHVKPEYALSEGLKNSSICLTIQNGHPLSMFGICPVNLVGDKAVIWLLATDDLMDVKFEFLRYSRKFIEMMMRHYPLLYNWVSEENKASIYWLQKIGAHMDEPIKFGLEGKLFRYFYFKRS